MKSFARLLLALAATLAIGCGKSQMSSQFPRGSDGPANPRALSTAQLFEQLSPSCEGCHKAGSATPFFSSLAAFENLLVYNERYVSPGAPDASQLIKLLDGNAPGTLKQMPLGGDPYAMRVQRGDGRVSMAEIRIWITGLSARQVPPSDASRDAALARRKSAEQVVSSLKNQLGLSDADFFTAGYGDAAAELYPARSPDATPMTPAVAQANYVALGGPSWLKSKKANGDPSTVFAEQLVPMSQAWCRIAVQKASSAILVDAGLSDSSSAPNGADRIQRNIARLHLRMLGEPAAAADTAELLELFRIYEPSGTDVAWTAVCAALVRHPLWVTF